MESLKKNKRLCLNKNTIITLEMIQEGILGKLNKLMTLKEAREVNDTGYFKSYPLPYSFILPPAGQKNQATIQKAKKGDVLDIFYEDQFYGEINVEDVYPIDVSKRVINIFGFYDKHNKHIKNIISTWGELAVGGTFWIKEGFIHKEKKRIENIIKTSNATKITGMMLGTNPLTRVHERMIRNTLDCSDLLIIFLIKPSKIEGFSYKLREEVLEYFIKNYLPQDKVLIVPFESTYLFSGQHNLILQSIVASNFGCTNFAIGQNHSGTSMFYDKKQVHLAFDKYKNKLPIEIDVYYEYVYCDKCRTLVSINTCPHGAHHHVKYNCKALKQLLYAGVMPPAIFMRREISAMILSHLHKGRFENMQEMYYNLFPSHGLIETKNDNDFYIELAKLYHTASMV